MNITFLEFAKKIQSISQIGLTYAQNSYDIERYEQLKIISLEMMETLSDTTIEKIRGLFEHEKEYPTPKVDVRGVIFRGDTILMVQEKLDQCWSLPGGWSDIGYTPNEIAVKEVWEESGLIVEPVRLLAILDKRCHHHPPSPWYVYKIFILCRETGGSLQAGTETLAVDFFPLNTLPDLSIERITAEQIQLMFEYKNHPDKVAICD
jgi:ADP-ribose pyrophosphatase YjhB (NUDIX family)